MKLTLSRETLQNAITAPAGIAERRTTIPILACLKITADDAGVLSAQATTMDRTISRQIKSGISVTEPGTICTPARPLLDLAKRLPDAQIAIETDENVVTIRCGRSKFRLPTLPPEDFPVPHTDDAVQKDIVLPVQAISTLFARTMKCASREETRYYLQGVFLHPQTQDDKSYLTAAATDGHRMAVASIEKSADIAPNIIPTEFIQLILKNLPESGDVTLTIGERVVAARIGDLWIQSKTIDGTYPDYERVIPAGGTPCTFDREPLTAAVDRISIAGGTSSGVRLTTENGTASLFAEDNSGQGATGTEMVDCETDAEIRIGFNSRYLGGMLADLAGETVVIEMQDGNSAARITDPEDDSLTYILMPMRV